jgi:hypothetical protein
MGMERVLRQFFIVAGNAIDRRDVFFMRNFIRVKSGVTGDAGDFGVHRRFEGRIVDEQRNFFSLSLFRQRFVGMTVKAVLVALGKNAGCEKSKQEEE